MSCILSSSQVQIPAVPDQDQIDLDIGVATVADVIVHGRVTFCDSNAPVIGAIVKVFDCEGEGVCHTFSGCDGLYMLRIPAELAGQLITIAATCTNCPCPPEPCECPEGPS